MLLFVHLHVLRHSVAVYNLARLLLDFNKVSLSVNNGSCRYSIDSVMIMVSCCYYYICCCRRRPPPHHLLLLLLLIAWNNITRISH